MNLRSIFSLFSSDLAIDLGTANTLVFASGRGIVVSEPSIVAINKVTNKVEAVGNKAKEMLGRTPGNIVAIRPMKDGVIANFEVTEKMLQHFIRKAHGGKQWVSPRIVIGIPSEITQVERRAVEDSAYRAKASEVYLVEEAMAAAIGAGLPITEPHGNMVVDIGGGTTDIAVISLSGIVYSKSVRVAGNEMDESIIQYIKRKYNLLIGERTAEQIKMELGSAAPLDEPMYMEINGRNLIEGIPKTIIVTDEEIREALADSVATIVNAVRVALERTPPELSADIVDRGIVLTGGGSLLKNLDKRLMQETGSAGLDGRRPALVGRARRRQDAVRFRSAASRPLGRHDAAIVMFKCMKTISHREHREHREMLLSSVLSVRSVAVYLTSCFMTLTDRAKDRAKKNPRLLLFVLVVLHLILISLNRVPGQPNIRYLQVVMMAGVTPLQWLASHGVSSVKSLWGGYFDLRGAKRENEWLKARNSQLESQIIELQEKAKLFERLEALNRFPALSSYQRVNALVIGRDSDNWFKTILIDRGSIAGVEKDHPVMTTEGLVGRVISVSPISSRVLLITDERHGAGAVVAQTAENRLVGTLKGKNQALLELKFLSEGGKLENGEQVITSGQDQLYPKGLLIGRIKNLTTPEVTAAPVDVEPAAGLEKLETVSVLLVPRQEIRRQFEELVKAEKDKEKERQDKTPDHNRR